MRCVEAPRLLSGASTLGSSIVWKDICVKLIVITLHGTYHIMKWCFWSSTSEGVLLEKYVLRSASGGVRLEQYLRRSTSSRGAPMVECLWRSTEKINFIKEKWFLFLIWYSGIHSGWKWVWLDSYKTVSTSKTSPVDLSSKSQSYGLFWRKKKDIQRSLLNV